MEQQGLFVGLIPDKNRTWAKEKNQTDTLSSDQLEECYLKGGDVIKEVITVARDESVKIIALWGMSDKNMMNRPEDERKILYGVFEHFLTDLHTNWMNKPENKDVRFVHMGRRDNFEREAPQVVELIDHISTDTRERTGMVVAVGLDYAGWDEHDRAMMPWLKEGAPNPPRGWQAHLDLPRQGVPFQPLDLLIRTGKEEEGLSRTNEYLHFYHDETRGEAHATYLPDYSGEQFKRDLKKFCAEKQNRGA
jgi:undecaprenyl diphosphate synthase